MAEVYPETPDEVISEVARLVHLSTPLRKAGEQRAEDAQYQAAVRAYDTALRRTVEYIEDGEIRGAPYSKEKEKEISKLWSEASIAISTFDPALANRCFIKGQGWLKPSVWKSKRYRNYKIGIDDMREALMDLNERRHAEVEAARVATNSPAVATNTQRIATESQQNIGTLTALLDRAVAFVPRVGLAWGIVGVAAAAAIINVILGLNKLALASVFLIFAGMVIVFVFSQIPARDPVTRAAGRMVVAAIAAATVIFIGSSLWAAMFCAPRGFVHLFGLDAVCRPAPPALSEDKEKRKRSKHAWARAFGA
jgi:hypothetical protein